MQQKKHIAAMHTHVQTLCDISSIENVSQLFIFYVSSLIKLSLGFLTCKIEIIVFFSSDFVYKTLSLVFYI